MRNIAILFAVIAIVITACNDNTDKNIDKEKLPVDSTAIATGVQDTTVSHSSNADDHIGDLINQYISMKNALAADNSKAAATAGRAFVESMSHIDRTSFPDDKKKAWDDVAEDAKEMADHIGKNANKIDHQRFHFDMLSKDIYDIVKAFGSNQTLYETFCPMYNDNKGASWLSETREIKNPYFGKKMSTCGNIKEEIVKK